MSYITFEIKSTEAVPSCELPLIPTKIKPTCAIDEKARKRLKLSCRIANRFPMIMVRREMINNILYHAAAIGLNTVYKTDTKTNNTAPFDTTERKDVTATGAPS